MLLSNAGTVLEPLGEMNNEIESAGGQKAQTSYLLPYFNLLLSKLNTYSVPIKTSEPASENILFFTFNPIR
jgi:hypothetical protein